MAQDPPAGRCCERDWEESKDSMNNSDVKCSSDNEVHAEFTRLERCVKALRDIKLADRKIQVNVVAFSSHIEYIEVARFQTQGNISFM